MTRLAIAEKSRNATYFMEIEWMNEWMNEKKIYIARLQAYKCMLNLPRLAEH